MSENPLLERARRFLSALRHCQVLGLTVEAADEKGLTLRLPYSQAIITLMDTTCGISTVCVLPDFEICPTLDLRIDYMHPAEPHKDVYGFAECYRVTPNVIFTRGFAYQDDPGQPIAHVVGAFMRMGGSARAGAARPAAQGGAA